MFTTKMRNVKRNKILTRNVDRKATTATHGSARLRSKSRTKVVTQVLFPGSKVQKFATNSTESFFYCFIVINTQTFIFNVGKTERQDYVAILFQWLKFLLFRYITSIAWVRGKVSEIRIRDSAHFYAAIPSPCFVQQNRVNTRPTCPKVSRQPPRQLGSIKDRYKKKNTIW